MIRYIFVNSFSEFQSYAVMSLNITTVFMM